MSSTELPANATRRQIEEELEFHDILIGSLDMGSDEYAEKLAGLEEDKRKLEQRLDQAQSESASAPLPYAQSMGVDGANDRDSWWTTTLNSPTNTGNMRHGNSSEADLLMPPSRAGVKRTLPESSGPYSQGPSKRTTPQGSNASTPVSSLDGFERGDKFPSDDVDSVRRQRLLALESSLRRQRDSERADAEYARSLEERPPQPSRSQFSGRSNVQTTLNHNGSYHRPPPPVKNESFSTPPMNHFNAMAGPASNPRPPPPRNPSTPYNSSHSHPTPSQGSGSRMPQTIKAEPQIKSEPRGMQGFRRVVDTSIVDLTGSDDEDDYPQIVPNTAPSGASRQNGANRWPAPPILQYPNQMPGAFPQDPSRSGPPGMYIGAGGSRPPPASIRERASGAPPPTNELDDLHTRLVAPRNAQRREREIVDITGDDGDDLIFGSSRPVYRAAGYDNYRDLYRNRYETIANYDPAKSQEEINDLLTNIRPDEDMPAHLRVQTPAAMNVELHKYQELGLTWLQKCEDGTNNGGILADDMGLGKTIQMLSLMVTHKSNDPRCRTTLIVAPVALMRQWKQEIEQKIKPRERLTVYTQHGPSKKKDFRDLQHYDVVITTYGSLASEMKKLEKFHMRKAINPDAVMHPTEKCALIGPDCRWYRVILDEAQCIKNKTTQTAKAASQLTAKYRFCMTGTPMMNNVGELYSLINFLKIAPYKQWDKFRMDFGPLFKTGPTEQSERDLAMQKLQALCKAIMLRRTKSSKFEGQPILVLPERTTDVKNPVFDQAQKEFYDAIETKSQLQFNRFLRNGQVGTQYSAILVLLLRLRQAACHPHLIKDFGVAAAADITEDDVLNFAKELGDPIVSRIKETGGNFECPVCYDAVSNPVIYIPCGHDTCRECFTRITDPESALRNGNEDGGGAKCPNCRGVINAKRVTDFDAFKKVHMPELLSLEEQEDLKSKQVAEAEEDADSSTDDDSDDDAGPADDVDNKGNLKDFIIDDDATTEDEDDPKPAAGSSKIKDDPEGKSAGSSKVKDDPDGNLEKIEKSEKAKGKSKEKPKKKQKKGKGKGKEKEKKNKKKSSKALTLAELKRLSSRNAKARRHYIKRLRETWQPSAKIDKTLELLQTIMDDPEGEKVLIFSQWTSLLDLLEVPIDENGWGYRRYDGSMNSRLRGDAVDEFRDPNKNVRVMLVSLKAGNAGLNLNMASQVIILDPFWNPYIEEQAIDRAHRIGQTRSVKVHRMLVEGTVEDRIIELQEKKRAMISEALDEKAAQSISRLGAQELAYLFGVTSNPSQAVSGGRRR